MSDRYEFNSPFARGSGANPWFMIGSVAVTTTVFMTGLGILGIVLTVAEGANGPISGALTLDSSAITRGQLWRLVTWPIPVDAGAFFFAIIGIVFFYIIGSQLEGLVGRRSYTALVGALLLVPGLLGVLVAIALDREIEVYGLSMIAMGTAIAFAAAFPQARSFFGIPFWVLIAVFFGIQLLTVLALRDVSGLVMLLTLAAIGLIGIRSLGFAPSVEWVPTVPLPAAVTGQASSAKRAPKSKRKNKAGLAAVPEPTATEAEIDALLDQVADRGFDSLNRKEKQILQRHSKEMRKRREQ